MVENCIVLIFKVDKILKNIRFLGKSSWKVLEEQLRIEVQRAQYRMNGDKDGLVFPVKKGKYFC